MSKTGEACDAIKSCLKVFCSLSRAVELNYKYLSDAVPQSEDFVAVRDEKASSFLRRACVLMGN